MIATTSNPTSATASNPVYRPDLRPPQLIDEIGALRRQKLVIERLVCRYLADLADRLARNPASGSTGGYRDVFEASERILGHGTRATRERVRVGRALRLLPRIEHALEHGELSFARAREITRVARAETESTWLELGKRLPVRELERRVADAGGRAPKDASSRTASARSVPDTVHMALDLPFEDWIALQKALQTVRDTASHTLTDTEAVIALARTTLATCKPNADAVDAPEEPTRAHRFADTIPETGDASDEPVGSRPARAFDRHDPAGTRGANDEPDEEGGAYDEPDAEGSAYDEPDEEGGAYDGPDAERAECDESDAPNDTCDGLALVGDDSDRDSVAPGNDDPAGALGDSALRNTALLLQHFPSRSRWRVDQLCEATGLGVSAVSVALLTLELQGTIQREDWAYYTSRAA